MKDKVQFLKKPIVVCLLASFCCMLWGSAFPSIKRGYEFFHIESGDVASQLLFAGYRFTLAGILTIIIGSLLARKVLFPKKESWHMVGKLASVQTVLQYIFFYVGLAHTTGVKGSIINGSQVFIAILMACLIFKYEKLTLPKLMGCIIGFAGVVIINLNGSAIDAKFTLLGEGFVLFASIAYALSSALMKTYSTKENPVTLSGYQFLFGGIVMCIIGKVGGGNVVGFTATSTALLIYMAMISAVAYSVWGILLKYNPVGKVAIFGFTNPVFGVLLSAIFLGEKNQAFGWQGIVALVLVCIGIFIVNKQHK